MGALHRGHIVLVRQATKRARRVVVSIFVNPAQFAPSEDFASYPRNFAADIAVLAAEKVDLVWAPSADGDVPGGLCHPHRCREGAAKAGLEDKIRPHFFGGVATVVAKLFTQVHARFRHVRRKRLPATARRHADGEGSRSGREGDRRADSARSRTVSRCRRATLTCRRASAPSHRRFIACSRRAPPTSSAASRSKACSATGRAEIERAGFALDYLEARHAHDAGAGQSRRRTDRSGCWWRPKSARRG